MRLYFLSGSAFYEYHSPTLSARTKAFFSFGALIAVLLRKVHWSPLRHKHLSEVNFVLLCTLDLTCTIIVRSKILLCLSHILPFNLVSAFNSKSL